MRQDSATPTFCETKKAAILSYLAWIDYSLCHTGDNDGYTKCRRTCGYCYLNPSVFSETGVSRALHLTQGEGPICKIVQNLQFLAGSFSAVSKRNLARKYAFDSIFQALQDVHTFALLQTQHFSKKSV